MPRVRFDFFIVHTAESDISFEQALGELKTKTDAGEGVLTIDGRQCCLLDALNISGYHACLFTKIRMDGLPSKTNLSGNQSSLELGEDEGLGEDAALAYSPSLKVAAIQRNKFSLSPNNIAKLVNHFYPALSVSLTPILASDTFEKFAKCNHLRKLRVKLAGTDNFSFLESSDLSATEKIAIQEMLSEPFVDITFSTGRKKGFLHNKIYSIASMLSKFYKSGGDETVLAVEVTGKESEDSPSTVIDLLSERLTSFQDVAMKEREIDKNHLLRVACESLRANHNELTSRHV